MMIFDGNIRWKQRLSSYSDALNQLKDAVELRQERELSNLEKQGFVKAFEFTHELAWKLMKDFFIYQGNTSIMGSRDATREAFQNNIITDGESWMEMIIARNKAVHIYDEKIVEEVINKTTAVYYSLYLQFEQKMKGIADGT